VAGRFRYRRVAGFIWLLFWLPIYNTPDKIAKLGKEEWEHIHSDQEEKSDKDSVASLVKRSLRYRQTGCLSSGKFMTDPVWWFFSDMAAGFFFKKTYGLNIKKSWVQPVTITLI